MTPVLRVNELYLAYGSTPILKGVSFNLAQGEVISLLGASGSGKTTLLRAIAGLESPTGGQIHINDQTVYDQAQGVELLPETRNLGLVFQSYALWPHRNVFDNIAYGLKLRRVPAGEIRQRVEQVLRQLGLADLAQRFPHQLSGGQQQRVALGRALVYNPPLILLDEPLSNLDAKLREEARAWLRELIVTLGLTALVVTHDQSEAMAMSDHILLLSEGRIEQQGTPQEMYAAPRSLYAAEFMGSNNRLAGIVTEVTPGRARIEGPGWSLSGATTGQSGLSRGDPAVGLIRLERVGFSSGPGPNVLAARLTTSMYLGNHWEHLFQLGETTLRALSPNPLAEKDCWLALPENQLWVFKP